MIEKNEILQLAQALGLNADTVEKDYILGWMLDGIYNHRLLGNSWLFKGGTSLKKCFFETYRFSEDLDFTVIEPAHMDADFLLSSLKEVADFLYEKSGIGFNKDMFKFKVIPKENERASAQGVVHYIGPLGRKQSASIKLDLTTDEIVILDSVSMAAHHPYTDLPDGGISVNCYAFEEVIAEKVRALGQRVRPRDVYDVVHFYRNREMIKNPQLVHNVLIKKCGYKKMQVPTFESVRVDEKIDELESQWSNMLAHQLPNLPPLASFWNDVGLFFEWLNSNLKIEKKVPVGRVDERIFQPSRIANAFSIDSVLQRIQFAAANRICVNIRYHDKERTVEPLSFRISNDGNRLFYGFEREAGQPKAYALNKIQGLQISALPYREREFKVEIGPGPISMPLLKRRST